MSLIAVEGLTKRYGELLAVDALDLAVDEGELFGFLGPNGAGKTTSISMISGVLSPTAGRVSLGGHDLHREPAAAKRLLGLVPQEIAVYETITARQNLRFLARLYELVGSAGDEAVDWALDLAGLADRADEPVERFSGGMKRRLNLVAGLMHRPKVLILDEPTVGVDPQSRAHIFDVVRRLNGDEGMTVLYTSHYMEEVESLCSRIAVMDHGRLVALDTLEGLVSAHAPDAIEVKVEGPADAIAEALSALGQTTPIEGGYRVEARDAIGPVVHAVEGAGGRIHGLEVLEADLATVFLHLTGHHLRDAS